MSSLTHDRKFFVFPLLACLAVMLTLLSSQWTTAFAASPHIHGQTASTLSSDWSQFNFNASRYNPNEHTIGLANISKLVPSWSVLTGANCASPAVVNGIVYTSPNGSYNASVIALNEKTGKKLWTVSPSGLSLCSSPAVANNIVYVSSGALYALNAKTGATIWSNNTFNTATSANVTNGIVYVATQFNKVVALNALTGKVLWTATTSFRGYINAISLTVANGFVYVVAHDNTLYAFNALTGATVWTTGTSNFIYSVPVVADGLVFIAPGGQEIDAFNASTGAEVWSTHIKISPSARQQWRMGLSISRVVTIN